MDQKKILVLVGVAVLAVALLFFANPASKPAETKAKYPDKPITLIIPWSAGGVTDVAARMFVPSLEKHLGQPITVVNTPGASGATGTVAALDKPADGYTIVFSAETPATFQVMGISEKSFNDLSVLMMMINDPKVIVVSKDSPYKTINDLIADIKAKPGKIRMSYSGPGASGHIQGLMYGLAGLKINITPFEGGNPALLAVMGNQVEFTNSNLGTVLDYIKKGDLRALAVFSDTPNKAIEGVPAVTDALPELKKYLPIAFPNCIAVAKDTPAEIKDIITKASVAASKEKAWTDFVALKNYETLHDLQGAAADAYWKKWSSLVSWLLWDNGVAKNSPEKYNIPKP